MYNISTTHARTPRTLHMTAHQVHYTWTHTSYTIYMHIDTPTPMLWPTSSSLPMPTEAYTHTNIATQIMHIVNTQYRTYMRWAQDIQHTCGEHAIHSIHVVSTAYTVYMVWAHQTQHISCDLHKHSIHLVSILYKYACGEHTLQKAA